MLISNSPNFLLKKLFCKTWSCRTQMELTNELLKTLKFEYWILLTFRLNKTKDEATDYVKKHCANTL